MKRNSLEKELETSNNIIGLVIYSQGKYEKALKSYNQSIKIDKQDLPSTHCSIQ